MAQEIQNQLVDLSDLGMNDSELFAHVDHNQLESEKITDGYSASSFMLVLISLVSSVLF